MSTISRILLTFFVFCASCQAQDAPVIVGNWHMQDAAKVSASPSAVSSGSYSAAGWYTAMVPGTVLTTLVDNHVYPDPLYGENMRAIPESLNRTSYWFRTSLAIPKSYKGRRTWLHFAGINYAAEVWIDGREAGTIKGAFRRGDFDITDMVKPGSRSVLAVLVSPEPHPGVPQEHTVANGTGHNGGITAIDGPTFLSTIGWDWLAAVRDRDTGIWLPVTLSSTGPVIVNNPYVTTDLSVAHDFADLHVSTTLNNQTRTAVSGTLVGTITGDHTEITFRKSLTVPSGGTQEVKLDAANTPALHLLAPSLWWPNGYGTPSLYRMSLRFETAKRVSDTSTFRFGVRSIEYEVTGSPNLTLVVNGVKVMVRGGNWGLDDAMKRVPAERLDAQFHMHALAHVNMIRNWVGQSTSPLFYEMADQYGILLWDEFFQPNPSDGPNVTDIPTYLANVQDKILRFRNHPSIAVWCARNEGKPPRELDEALATIMARLDPGRLYQSSSTEGRGVSSHGPYYWRAPRYFYQINEAFKTETGSVSVPTIESIQGMMPQKDWETINDDWAQHDMAAGAQRGNEYPFTLARRYGPIRNLADFTRKAQLANYEAFRAMFESRNTTMFDGTTGILTWMSHPAQPSFVWQLYHYDLEPNAALFATMKAGEAIHLQFNEALRRIEVVNNTPAPLRGMKVTQTIYRLDGSIDQLTETPVDAVDASSTKKLYVIAVNPHVSELYFIKLDLADNSGKLISSNFYWQNVAEDDFTGLSTLAPVTLELEASRLPPVGATTRLAVSVHNPTTHIALMAHLQLHDSATGKRVLPVFYSDNYVSLAPGESRSLTVEAPSSALTGSPVLLVDGFNIDVKPVDGPVRIGLNGNAQPMHWPASNLVPATPASTAQR